MTVFVDEFTGVVGLIHVDSQIHIFADASKFNSEKMCDRTLKISSKACGKARFKGLFNGIAVAEIDGIIDKETKVERRLTFDDDTREDARCIRTWKEAEGCEGAATGVVPAVRTSFEAVESLFEKEMCLKV